MMTSPPRFGVVLSTIGFFAVAASAFATEPFRITVVDPTTGRGIPLVELKTVHHVTFVTDNRGVVAIDDPDLLGGTWHLAVRSHGYEYPADGFGIRGVRLTLTPGGQATISLPRINVAERVARLTGGGRDVHSVTLGDVSAGPAATNQGGVIGQDSVQNAIYRGRLFWTWGDTSLPGYPLGRFHMTGAWSDLSADGRHDPETGVRLDYLVGADGLARNLAEMDGPGPTWLGGPIVVDHDGKPTMIAHYAKIQPPLSVYRRGFGRWNEESETFEHLTDIPLDAPIALEGHAVRVPREDGMPKTSPPSAHRSFVHFNQPVPLIRTDDDLDSVSTISRYETYTCLKSGTNLHRGATPERPAPVPLTGDLMDRDADGLIQWGWKAKTSAVTPSVQKRLRDLGHLADHEGLLQIRDLATGTPVQAHNGDTVWNVAWGRWTAIFTEIGGTSPLGEIWYAEAATPIGPWVYARKVVTHDDYTFYNPKWHPYFSQKDDRIIYFEGTYTHTFSGEKTPTPRYDYNQILYRLDLEGPDLAIPVPMFADGPLDRPTEQLATFSVWQSIAFFAPDCPGRDLVPVYRTAGEGDGNSDDRWTLKKTGAPTFYAHSADGTVPREGLVPLHADGTVGRSSDPESALVWVWPNPYAIPRNEQGADQG